MRTVIVTSIPPLYGIPLIFIFMVIGKLLLKEVHLFLKEVFFPLNKKHPALTASLWIFSIFGYLIIISPPPLSIRITSILALCFFLKISVIDAASGFLPKILSIPFILSGLLTRAMDSLAYMHIIETLLMAILMYFFNFFINRKQIKIGSGDLWFVIGLTAWFGLYNSALITLSGLTAFLFWHSTWQLSGKQEGPIGPWFCISGSLFLLIFLYQPVWIS
ncbi:prepilin peptidase [Pectobacterium atrosepticum]|uniref:prepilin peptidase n=1 Tax=Pectobacterium atrosepticum TaxID=29471 RepID=UPI003016B13F